MTISVIVPYKPGEAHLSTVLNALHASAARAPAGVAWEILPIAGAAGVSAARNAGLAAATGDYLAWVDADDDIDPIWAPRLAAALVAQPDVLVFDARVVWLDRVRPAQFISRGTSGGVLDAHAFLLEVARARAIGARLWNRVFRRALFDGLRFEAASFEDYRIQLDVLRRAQKVIYLPEALYIYRRSATGLSQYGESAACAEALAGLVRYARTETQVDVRAALAEGIAVMLADFLFHAGGRLTGASRGVKGALRAFLRTQVPGLLASREHDWRLKIKCLLALVR